MQLDQQQGPHRKDLLTWPVFLVGLLGFGLIVVLFFANRCESHSLTKERVEIALLRALESSRVSGTIRVTGIQEAPYDNSARADLYFDNFQYNTERGVLLSGAPKPLGQPGYI